MATTKKAAPVKAAKPAASKPAPSKPAPSKPAPAKMEESEFHEFFVDEIKDIYWAEKHLVKALPKLRKAATSPELAACFEKHTAETQTHIEALDKVFELLGKKPQAKKCDAMEGLLEEATSIIEDTDEGTMIRDAGLILAAQKIEHYEIATYGTLATFCKAMGNMEEIGSLLYNTLENEKATDLILTQVAESAINSAAVAE